ASFPWLEKIDFLTSHPKDVSVKLARVIASYPNINREIHFPVQHADDNILRQMKRGYTLQEYRDKVKYLRKIVPGICIGTDVIVGFPGETEKAFNTLLTAIREIGFDWVNTAAYSDRPGTEAAAYSQKLSKAEKKRRLNILNNMLKTGKDDSI
ncbi:MAG TPA: radical SAM protein, partial [Spirochaetota bacterium]|nr:radical SAM protein [Spirochaetota bacterium]